MKTSNKFLIGLILLIGLVATLVNNEPDIINQKPYQVESVDTQFFVTIVFLDLEKGYLIQHSSLGCNHIPESGDIVILDEYVYNYHNSFTVLPAVDWYESICEENNYGSETLSME